MNKMAKRRGNNEGSISKRKDGSWHGYITVGKNLKTDDPKRKYYYGRTRKDVQEKIKDAVNKMQNGTYIEPSKLTVAEWLNTWIEEYQKTSLRLTTWESYKTVIDCHIIPAIGSLPLSKLQTYHLQTLYNDKQKDGTRSDGKPGPLSPRTVRYIHMIIRSCLEQAKKEGRIIINPADATKLPVDPKKDILFLDTEQVKIFLAEARKTDYFVAYFLALNTGVRRGELLGLRWEDVNLKEGHISINQSLVRVKSGLIFQEPKTKLSKRMIGISKTVIKELKKHRKLQTGQMKEAAEAYENYGLVFCNEIGKPIDPNNFARHYKRIFERINREIENQGKKNKWKPKVIAAKKIKPMPFHALRHTFATLCLQQGTDPRTMQEALGHSKVAFTLDVYSGVTAQMKKEAEDKIGNLMASCLE
jgi:integrase